MHPRDIVSHLLSDQSHTPQKESGHGFAPSNIALCKYWGKRDASLNLPRTSSLSISLGKWGSHTTISPSEKFSVTLDGKKAPEAFSKRLEHFIALFQPILKTTFRVETYSDIPVAAGLASSASGFAALIKAFKNLYNWELPNKSLSILARLGSGSASRSIYEGFVLWHQGQQSNGLDSFAEPLFVKWPDFRLGLCILENSEKPISSREAMQRSIDTSPFYQSWPTIVEKHLPLIQQAIHNQDIHTLGETSEKNALAMHATMTTASPPIQYCTADTINLMKQIWKLRNEGIPVYFTQDAGPNLKLLFTKEYEEKIKSAFPTIALINPFAD